MYGTVVWCVTDLICGVQVLGVVLLARLLAKTPNLLLKAVSLRLCFALSPRALSFSVCISPSRARARARTLFLSSRSSLLPPPRTHTHTPSPRSLFYPHICKKVLPIHCGLKRRVFEMNRRHQPQQDHVGHEGTVCVCMCACLRALACVCICVCVCVYYES